jgi:hypothetical protein
MMEAKMHMFSKGILALSFLASLAPPSGAGAAEAKDKLLIVNGNSGHVIYDDGRSDLYCVARRRVVGYDDDGYRIYRRDMRCR